MSITPTTPERTTGSSGQIMANSVPAELVAQFLDTARRLGLTHSDGSVNRSHAAKLAIEEWVQRHNERRALEERRDGADRRIPRVRRKGDAAA
jgi:hypothetical protein